MRQVPLVVTVLVGLVCVAPSRAAASEAFQRMATTMASGSVDAVRSLRASLTIEALTGSDSLRIEQDLSLELPDKMRSAVRTPLGRQVLVVNGDRGAALAAGRNEPAARARVDYARHALGRQLLLLAGNAGHAELQAVDEGRETVDGHECDVVAVTFLGVRSTLWIDERGEALRQRFEGRHFFEGTPGVVELRFSDYAELGGWFVPRVQRVSFDDRELAKITVNAIDVNPDLNPGLFEIAPD